jgi:hypothetical protein
MVDFKLTDEEVDLIKETLNYYRTAINESSDWPTYESKQERLKIVESVLKKIRT